MTNDIFTREDQECLIKNKALPASRILAIETGGCPHAAIREDISANMGALETLQAKYACQLLFVESGGDNLAANYSRELADYIIYVIDVSVCPLVSCDRDGLADGRGGREGTRSPAKAAQGSRSLTCSSSTRYGRLGLPSALAADTSLGSLLNRSTWRLTSGRRSRSWIGMRS